MRSFPLPAASWRPAWLRAGLPVFALCCAVSLSPALAQEKERIDARLDECLAGEKGQTTAGMIGCTGMAIDAWDAAMNRSYQRAMTALDPKSRALLRTAQRQWIAFRDAEKAALSGPWSADQGTLAQVRIAAALLSLVRERALELRLYAGDTQ